MMPLRSFERVGARQVSSRHQNMQQFGHGRAHTRASNASFPLPLSLYICKLGHYAKHEG